MNASGPPVFLYDFNSPYAYLAAMRVDEILPITPRWQPVAFAFILRAHNRSPWSFDDGQRAAGMAECERRAQRYGLAPLRWPPGWPRESYSLAPLRAALVAEGQGRLREFSRAAFARNFVHGAGLTQLSDVLEVAEEVGLDPGVVNQRVAAEPVKHELTEATSAAIAAGVLGVPTVLAAGAVFWGDDQLEAAATAMRAAGSPIEP